MSTVSEQTYTPEDLLAMPDRKKYELVDGHLVERHMSVLSNWVGGQLHFSSSISSSRNTRSAGPGRPIKVTFVSQTPPQGAVSRRLFRQQGPPAGRAHFRRLHLRSSRPRGRGRLAQRPGLRGRKQGPRIPGAGVALVWVIDPEARTVHIYRRDGSTDWLREDGELSGEDVLPGFRCRLATIFPEKTAGKPETG